MSIARITNLLLNQYPVCKKLFGEDFCSDYTFPTLITDDKGIFTGYCDKYMIYDLFTNNGEIIDKGEPRDIELEKFILDNAIDMVEIDLNKNPIGNKMFETTRCSIYPECIKDMPAIYDTLFICDYLLKFIDRMLLQAIVLDRTIEEIVTSNYVISFKCIGGKYNISNIYNRPGFTKLRNTIRLFCLKHKSQSSLIKDDYKFHRDNSSEIRINLNFPQLNYSLNDEYLQFHSLKPNLTVTYGDLKEQIPLYLTFVKKFVEEHYIDIKKAFPIYNRLENIHRLCSCVRFKNRDISFPEYSLVYTRTFPDSIMHCGGVLLQTNNFVKTPFTEHPLIKATQKIIENKSTSPKSFGYAPATDKQIIAASAPFVYNYLPHDSQLCITAKSQYYNAHSAMYNPDSIVRSHPDAPIIQSLSMKKHENTIQKECHPSSDT